MPGMVKLNALSSDYVTQEDLSKAARKVGDAKKHESKHFTPKSN